MAARGSGMVEKSPLGTLKLLADDTRWQLLHALRRSDRQVGELVAELRLPQNLISYHLQQLRQASLVHARTSDADGRALFYSLDTHVLQRALTQVGAALLISEATQAPVLAPPGVVVFLCTGNSARSQMAEGWLRHLSGGRIPVRSAGTHPRGVDPLAVQVMAEAGVDIGYQQSKGLEALADLAPSVAVTVCDIAREECPEWPTTPTYLHWSIADPVRVAEPSLRQQAFVAARDELHSRVTGLLTLLPTLATTA